MALRRTLDVLLPMVSGLLLSSEMDVRGLGVGTILTVLTSSVRPLKGPRFT